MGYDIGLNSTQYVMTHARSLSVHPAYYLEAAVDPNEENRTAFVEIYDRPAYASIVEAAQHHDFDIAVVASPTACHGQDIVAVLSNCKKVKFILCEKPLHHQTEIAQEIVSICKSSKVQLFVNYMRCCDPGAIEVFRRIKTGIISPPFKGVAWYTKGLRHNGSHLINLLQKWLGDIKTWKKINYIKPMLFGDADIDVQIKFETGQVTFLACPEESFYHHGIDLMAVNGRLRYDKGGTEIEWLPCNLTSISVSRPNLGAERETIVDDMNFYQWHVMNALAQSIAGQNTEICTGVQALSTLDSINKILFN